MLQIKTEIVNEALQAIGSFAQTLPPSQGSVLVTLANVIGRNLYPVPVNPGPEAAAPETKPVQPEHRKRSGTA